ncbi:leucine-rich repeat-containing protein 46 isoform X1 [Sagmatias obliquidens]|uniref:leucine-rich repeat-containing protein 46 isoform X1 n=1 Tax=Sagmatias obliquidens TaxID=3371155 RepID=UPI000F43EC3F|nr:leucine-rich repeat-containing protein 46 isoform X1 [Lagenorhynchus obliquidens]
MCVIHHQSLFPFPVSPWFPSLMSRSLFGCGVIRVLKSNLAQPQVYALNHPPGENKSSQGSDNQFKKWDDHSQSATSPASRVDMVLGLCPFKRPPIQLTSAWFPQLGFFLQNKIERIENLACVPSLRFLSLAGNRIRQVENLRDLPHLQFLDLSENLIEILKLGRNVLALAHGISPGGALPPLCSPSPCLHYRHILRGSEGLCKEAVALDRKVGVRTSLFLSLLCADEFPESLLILNLTGNSCTNQESYRRLVTEALPLLLDLDGQPVAERWTSDEEDQASSNEDEEFPELRGPFCSERGDPAFQGSQPPQSTPLPALWDLGEAKTAVVSGDVVPGPDQSGHAGFLKELEQETSRHREHRQQTALLEHLLRVEMRPALTDLPPLPGVPMAGNSSPSVPPRQGKETSPEPVSLPQASSATKKPCLPASRSQQSTVRAGKGAPSTTKTVTERIKK